MSTKAKAIEAASRALGPNASAIVFGAFVRGYMAGHAAHTRWANKTIFEYRDAKSAQQRSDQS